jgi:chromosome partitioning protein
MRIFNPYINPEVQVDLNSPDRSGHNFMLSVTDVAPTWKISAQGAHKFIREQNLKSVVIGKRAYLSPENARSAMLSRGIVFPQKTVCLQMLKGGVGKTTTALNLGIRASMYGARVLIIDLDQQANLSFSFGIENENEHVWADVLEGKCSAKSIVQKITPNLHIIPSNLNNSILDKILLSGKKNITLGIKQHLKSIRSEYDLVVIDTAPNLSAINVAASCASDVVVLPVNPDKFSFDGLQKTLSDLEDVKSEFSVEFDVKILFTKFDGRETSSRSLLQSCFNKYGDIMLKSFVRTSSDFKNVIRTGHSIFSHKSTAKEDYDVVTREILELDH